MRLIVVDCKDCVTSRRVHEYPSQAFSKSILIYLTIIPRARMGSESIAHEAEGRVGY